MKAAYIEDYGDFDQVKVDEMPKPVPGASEVLVEMKAASVNPIDWKLVHGDLKLLLKLDFPQILGSDGAGVIREVGSGVTALQPGDEVFFRCGKGDIGTYAEYFTLPAELVAKKPSRLSFEEAAGIPLVGLTAYQALVEKGGMKAGSRVLIHAGSGGVGSFAIQLAKAYDAYVVTTASQKNFEMLKSLGADEVIDYHTQRIDEVCSDIDIVFDTLGKSVHESSYKVMKPGGILVSLLGIPDPGTVKGYTGNFMVNTLARLNQWSRERQARKHQATYKHLLMYSDSKQLATLGKLIDEGKIHSVIDRKFPLDQLREAFEYSATGRAKGKIIINIG